MNAITPSTPEESQAHRTARHLATCRELAELGMVMARHAAHAAQSEWAAHQPEPDAAPEPAPQPNPEPTPDTTASQRQRAAQLHREIASPSLAFARLARCVRQTITLEIRIAADQAALNERAETRAAHRAFRLAEAARPEPPRPPRPAPPTASPDTTIEPELASLFETIQEQVGAGRTGKWPPYKPPPYLRTPGVPPSG